MKTLTTNTLLTSYIRTLLDFGFRVIVPDVEKPTYCHIARHNSIGYIQYKEYEGLEFITVHVPNKSTGTGFLFKEGVTSPTVQDAIDLLNYRGWNFDSTREYYKNLEHFLQYKDRMKMKYREVTLE
jgi:hypothetical protein